MKDELFIECDCGGEILKIIKWDDDYDLFSITYFFSGRHSFFARVKYAWQYLLHGEYYGSDILVKRDDLNRIIEFFQQARELKEPNDQTP